MRPFWKGSAFSPRHTYLRTDYLVLSRRSKDGSLDRSLPIVPKALSKRDGFEGNKFLFEKESVWGRLRKDQCFIHVSAVRLLIFNPFLRLCE